MSKVTDHTELIAEARNYPYVDYGILINDLADALEVVERERDEAWVDNAALCSAIMRCHGADVNGSYFAITPPDAWREVAALLRTDSPGAALLARMERLEELRGAALDLAAHLSMVRDGTDAPAWMDSAMELLPRLDAALDALSESEAAG